MECLQNMYTSFLCLVIEIREKLKMIITVKCSHFLPKIIFRSYFHLQNLAMQCGEAVFAVVTKVNASAFPLANNHKKPDSDFCYSCLNEK